VIDLETVATHQFNGKRMKRLALFQPVEVLSNFSAVIAGFLLLDVRPDNDVSFYIRSPVRDTAAR
jgi:hypothetical protein